MELVCKHLDEWAKQNLRGIKFSGMGQMQKSSVFFAGYQKESGSSGIKGYAVGWETKSRDELEML